MNSDNWKECERNVQLYKELNAKHIDVECGRNSYCYRTWRKPNPFTNISYDSRFHVIPVQPHVCDVIPLHIKTFQIESAKSWKTWELNLFCLLNNQGIHGGLEGVFLKVKPLSPKSDQHLFSPNNICAQLFEGWLALTQG